MKVLFNAAGKNCEQTNVSRATDATCDIQKFQRLEKQILSLYANTAFLFERRNRYPLLKKPRCPKGVYGLLATVM